MDSKHHISTEEVFSIGIQRGIDWTQIDLERFRRGIEVELEHGAHDPETNVTGDDPLLTGKIAWAHLKEILLHTVGSARSRSLERDLTDRLITREFHD